jgi:hypothetical protein
LTDLRTRFAAQRRFSNAVYNGFAHRYHVGLCRDFVHIRYLRANPPEVAGPVGMKIRTQKIGALQIGPPPTKWRYYRNGCKDFDEILVVYKDHPPK